MNQSLSIFIPLNKPLPSIANISEHWRAGVRRKNILRNLVNSYSRAEILIREWNFPVKVTLIRVSPRHLDSDNLQAAFKTIRDTVASIFFPDKAAGRADDLPCFKWCYDQTKKGAKQYGFYILIEELGE